MRIKRCPIIFHNVISTKANCKPNEWLDTASDLRNAVIKNGLYGTGPIFYQILSQCDGSAEYTFYLPVSNPIKMTDNDKYKFEQLWKCDDGLTLRHANLDEYIEESYEILRTCAEGLNVVLKEPFYNIYLNVYGDGIVDIYAPIVEER